MLFRTLTRVAMATLVFGVALSLRAQERDEHRRGLDVQITTEAPPPPRYDHRGHRPGHDYIWVNGSWAWENGRWDWERGRWERRHEEGVNWVSPRYIRMDNGGYIYEPGHWSNENLVVSDEVRGHREWREHHRDYDRDRDHDRDRNL